MKDKIIARLTYYKNVAEDSRDKLPTMSIAHHMFDAKANAFEQAIAIVEEVMKK